MHPLALPALDSPKWQSSVAAFAFGAKSALSSILALVLFGTKDVNFADPIAHLYLFTPKDRRLRTLAGSGREATTAFQGGTGDVLTGVITALVCQHLTPFDAARLGVHVHGLAGDLAAKQLGQVSLIASDLIDYLPAAFQASPR